MESIQEKVMLTLISLGSLQGIPGDIIFLASTCVVYFFQETQELHLLMKLMVMVFVLECRVS